MIETLKQWSLALVITSFIGGISTFVVSETNKNMKKYIKFACSVVALAVMITPIKGLLQEMPKVFSSNSEITSDDYSRSAVKSDEWILTKSVSNLKSGISNAIYQKFGIKSSNIYIYIKRDDINSFEDTLAREVIVEKIRIEIAGSEIVKPEVTDDENENKNESEEKEEERDINKVSEKIKNYLTDLLDCEIIVDVI